MKKIIMFVLAIVALTVNTYAVNFSLGFTAVGFGRTFIRGNGYWASDYKNDPTISNKPFSQNLSFAPMFSVIGQVDFNDYLGMEIGVGYSQKETMGYETDNLLAGYLTSFVLNQINVPVLLKAQYEFAEFFNLYVLVGPKFNFNIKPPILVTTLLFLPITGELRKEYYNVFDMDISFALGGEFKVKNSHYIGARVAYDLNVIGTFRDSDQKQDNTFVDDFAVSFTYRYKFGA